MDQQLEKLKVLMPPPQNPKQNQVDWHAIEETLGLKYPTSFKDFIGVYGASKWLDYYSPFYLSSDDELHILDFRKTADFYLKYLKDKIYSGKQSDVFTKNNYISFPEPGCFLPFMIDEGSNFYFWKTNRDSPENWPIIIGPYGELNILKNTSITEMFLSYLTRKPPMFDIWGDINDVSPEELKVE